MIPAEEAAKVDPKRILPIPARFVRTNKGDDENIVAKLRIVVPGHLAPKDENRTDAPIAPQVFLYMIFSWTVNCDWEMGTFDVKNAFLSGEDNPRKLYVRPPKEGIRGVPPDCLLELVKGVLGLKESPRLWWLKLRSCILEAGFEELKYVPGAFVLREPNGDVCGLLGVHVDDGPWAGAGASKPSESYWS